MKNVVQDLTSAGIDWQREKWQSGLGSKFIHQGEKNAAKYADEVIVLSKGVQDYFKETYKGAEAMLYVTANECFTRFDGCICSVQLAEGFFEIRSLEDLNRLANSSVKKMDVSKFYHGDYYLEELKTIEGKRFGDRGKHQFK